MSFVDIAGIVKGASEGEGLGNKFLANIREAEAIAQVVRVFDDPDVIHVDGKVDPRSDMETINTELILADLQTIENAIPRIEKEVKIKKREAAELAAIKAAQAVLERGDTIFSSVKSDKLEMEHLKELSLLTAKPFIYVFNADEGILGSPEKQDELRAMVAPADAIFLDAKLESDLVELDEEEAREMLEMNGQDESGLDQLARVGFHTLGLQTYLTAGPEGNPCLDHPPGRHRPAGGRRDPLRLPARLHQGRGGLLRRPDRGRLHGRGQVPRQGPHRRQGIRDGRRRRGGVPLQRLELTDPHMNDGGRAP